MRLFADTPTGWLAGGIFTVTLLLAAIEDVRSRRIPNRVVVALLILGIMFCVLSRGLAGLAPSVEGILVGLACWLPFYMFGWLGAGDVKLFAASGAWLGPARSLEGALIGAFAGAVLAVIWMLKTNGVRKAAESLGLAVASPEIFSHGAQSNSARSPLPYGVAIAFGAAVAAWMPGILLH